MTQTGSVSGLIVECPDLRGDENVVDLDTAVARDLTFRIDERPVECKAFDDIQLFPARAPVLASRPEGLGDPLGVEQRLDNLGVGQGVSRHLLACLPRVADSSPKNEALDSLQ